MQPEKRKVTECSRLKGSFQSGSVCWGHDGWANCPTRKDYSLCLCVLVTQLCPTLCNPMDYSLPGSSVHGISPARVLKWVVISFSRGSSWSRDWTWVSCIGRGILYHWTTREAPNYPFGPILITGVLKSRQPSLGVPRERNVSVEEGQRDGRVRTCGPAGSEMSGALWMTRESSRS